MSSDTRNAFENAAASPARGGLVREFWDFLRHNKKWWLIPLVLIILLQIALLLLSSSAAAPFIYPVF